jgi:hypothetical protein
MGINTIFNQFRNSHARYTMATTPPPKSMEEINAEPKTEKSKTQKTN